MEIHHDEQQACVNGGKTTNNNNNTSSSNFLCRQSSTRWTPTTDQIRILKDLYYNNGVRSPTAEQIQRISAKLRQYGKIEGKNVFYWFQNHKARERQKKRFTTDHLHYLNIPNVPPMHHNHKPPNASNTPNGLVWNISNMSGGGGFPSSSTSLPVGYVGNYGGYGSMAIEKSFRECSITAGSNVNGGSLGQSNIAWMGMNEYPYYPFIDMKSYNEQTLEIEDEEEDENHEIETLPLFPMHDEPTKFPAHVNYNNGWIHSDTACPRASLELTLNSYFTNFNN